jgi:broad specificity phosphatase PhoE
MGNLYLVRHAQASLGADDYDHLSDMGERQSLQLGRYLSSKKISFDAVLSGTLRRHSQTLAGISEGMDTPLHTVQWPGLNEYDSAAVIGATHSEPLLKPSTPEGYRQHFLLLRQGLVLWMHGKTAPLGMPSWIDFRQGVVDVLTHIQQSGAEQVLLISSGGPIACILSHVLQTPPESTVELNMRLRNSAISELVFSPKRYALQTYNTLPHLDSSEFNNWISHA